MASAIKWRVTFSALAFVLLALMIGWAAHTTWSRVNQLREKFTRVQIESFNIADRFQATLKDLDYILLRFEINKDRADWNSYTNKSDELNRWIDVQKKTLITPREKEILERIDRAYDYYLEAAGKLEKESMPISSLESSLERLKSVEKESNTLLGLGFQLASAHRASLDLLLSQSQRSLLLLRGLIFGALFLLLVLGGWLAVVVYREMITPLRQKLIESHAIIERQEKLASLGVLAAGVAHEIRNPLTAIKARLFTQQKILKPGSPEHEDALVIGNEINRLDKIVKDVLHFARPTEPSLVTLAADLPLLEVRELLAPQFEKQFIQLKLDSLVSTKIQADPQQLKQVLINLIQNAAESIERNGSITLRARTGMERLNGNLAPVVILEVTDTGKGIPPEVQKRLFDPFFSTKETGTGLGLAIAARIVEKHGGALEFQTQINRGTTFGIILPQAKSS